MVFPPSLEFIIAFLACLKAGIVAVPIFPPHPSRKDTLLMFGKIVQACGAKYALTNSAYNNMKKLASLKDAMTRFKGNANAASWPDSLKWISIDTLTGSKKSRQTLLEVQPNDLAFLQFTSGSTSTPKGVMITHQNLADNLTKITSELEAGDDTFVVSWLPQYHDMGLIGSHLGILYCGGSGYYMSPLTFLQRPSMWIEAISKYRGTHLQAPNFAFKLTARKFDKSKYPSGSIDLSCVRHIINAAEPVTEESIETFCSKFCPYGLDQNVIYPTYGLAEHTVFVCSGGKQRLSVSKQALEINGVVKEVASSEGDEMSRLVGCGFPAKQNVDVKIVNIETFDAVEEDKVGEIWIKSDSKAAGYYRKPFETKRDFCAMIGNPSIPSAEGDENERVDTSQGYLRSGDLGFLHNGELFVCGRIKDLIIVGGRNYYPQDIEATAEASDERIRPGCSAAFTVDPISGMDEEVALVLELREVPQQATLQSECSALAEKLKATINQEHSLSLSHVVILRPRSVPKTTSGKITRAGCRKAFIQKTLQAIHAISFNSIKNASFEIHQDNPKSVDPETIRRMEKSEIKAKLTQDIGRIISMPASSVPLNNDLATMMDSLSLSQFKGLIEAQYATTFSDEYLFREGTTVSKLVEVVKLGYAPDDTTDADGNGGAPPVASTSNGGLAEAMGCPPGVCCVVM